MAHASEDWDKTISLVIKANRDLAVADLVLRRAVRVAKTAGHSWAAIGFALGVSRQAAQQRFGTTGAEGE
jgi:hypothetical protein